MRNSPPEDYHGPALQKVFTAISEGMFGNKEELTTLIDTIRNKNDYYLVCHDFYSYLLAQEEVTYNKTADDNIYLRLISFTKTKMNGTESPSLELLSLPSSAVIELSLNTPTIYGTIYLNNSLITCRNIEAIEIPKPALNAGEVLKVKSYSNIKGQLKHI